MKTLLPALAPTPARLARWAGRGAAGHVILGLLLVTLSAPPAPLAAQEGCRPESVEAPIAWSEALIGLLRENHFDEAAMRVHRHSCIGLEQVRTIMGAIERWKAADEIAYFDLIQASRLGNTFEKLTYAIRDSRDNFLFIELKFNRISTGLRLFNIRYSTELEEVVSF